MTFKTNTLATQTKIITEAINNSPFSLHDSIIRFEDFTAIAAYGLCKIQIIQVSMDDYKLTHLNGGWERNKNYRPEAHFLPSLKARLTELAQITDTLAAEAEAIKWYLVSLTGCGLGDIEITSPVAGRYGFEPRLVKISFKAKRGGATAVELAEACAGKLKVAGMDDAGGACYGLVYVWDNKVKAAMVAISSY